MIFRARSAFVLGFLCCAITPMGACSAGEGSHTPSAPTIATETEASAVLTTLGRMDAFRDRLGREGVLEPGKNGGHRLALANKPVGEGRFHPAGGMLDVEIPADGDGALRLTSDSGVWITVAPEGHAHVRAKTIGAAAVANEVALDTDLVYVATPGSVEELRVLRSASANASTRYRVTRGPQVASIRVREGRVEVIDVAGVVRMTTLPMFAVDALGERREVTVALDGTDAFVATLDPTGLTYPIAIDPAWVAAGLMNKAQDQHNAVRLTDGRVLVFAGNQASRPYVGSEAYDPKTNKWNVIAASQPNATAMAFAFLASGKLLAAGGYGALGPVGGAQIFDPVANTWTAVTSLTNRRSGGFAARLPSGNVIVFGGTASGGASAGSEIYNPTTNAWTAGASMSIARDNAASAVIAGNKILVTGGAYLATTEVYDMATASFSASGAMAKKRSNHTATVLATGQVLVVGGEEAYGVFVNTAELYDPTTKTFTAAGTLGTARSQHAAALLPSGKVLVVGGKGSAGLLASAEMYDPVTKKWSTAGAMATARSALTATTLLDGRVLAAGGAFSGGETEVAELFGGLAGAACAAGFECVSGFCTDSVCCDAAFCPTGATCATPEKKGTCSKPNGVDCTASTECATGICVDGVCCATACTGQCEACDTVAAKGTCTPISGSPHGTKPKCDTGGGDVCKARSCDGVKDATTCVGYQNGSGVSCKPGSCSTSLYTRESTCDGAGACVAPKETSCFPFKCDATGCLKACKIDDDCVKGFACKSGTCVSQTSTCSPDLKSSIPTTGSPTDCAPYLCDPKINDCRKTCVASDECASGFSCDTASGNCVPVANPGGGETESSGGCSTSKNVPGEGASFAWALVAGAMLLVRRARKGAR